MHVVRGLTGVVATIEDGAEATSGNTRLAGDVLGREEKILEKMGVVGGYVQNVHNVFLGSNENVNRGLGTDVLKGIDVLVLVHLLAGQGTLNNLAEDAFL